MKTITEEAQEHWYGHRHETRKLIDEFINQTDFTWAKERRIEFLEEASKEAYAEQERLKKLQKINPEIFFMQQELKNASNLYRRLWLEYHKLWTGKVDEPHTNTESEKEACRNVPVESLVGSFQDVGSGRKRMLCPFHEEKTGSFFVFGDNSWHCFGCQKNGQNSIDFIMAKNNYSFPEALDYLGRF